MCFNKEMTFGFTVLSCIIGTWILLGKGMWNIQRWRRIRISTCFYWFAFMEFLQFVQYTVIDQCNNQINIIWTAFGWFHIAFQPFFSNLAFSALDYRNINRNSPENKGRNSGWNFVLGYTLVAGTLMSLRLIIPGCFNIGQLLDMCEESTEGICGPHTCSTSGLYHVQWIFKMINPSYPFPSVSLHFIGMFVLPALMGIGMGSIILFATGPLIAAFFPVRDGERSAIWCFFSISECFITVFTQYIACRKHQKKQ